MATTTWNFGTATFWQRVKLAYAVLMGKTVVINATEVRKDMR